MRSISRRELDDLIKGGNGVVLVDHQAAGRERPSTLHSVTCKWVRLVGPTTPLRFEEDAAAAMRWLRRARGDDGEEWQRCPQCGAQGADGAGPASGGIGARSLGETIWALDRGRELAYVTALDGDQVEVAEFDSPERTAINRRWLSIRQTDRFRASAGQPCFLELDGEWRSARLADAFDPDDGQASVVADAKVRETSPNEVRFRRIAPLSDPVADLTGDLVGERIGFTAREALKSSYASLAALFRGLAGVASSAIDLHPHQVSVARRVLSDPVQRYLLADEVGLGKTIEAGLIIRQRLIDAPRSVVLVLVPSALIWQWEDELESKFRLSEFRRGGIQVDTFEDPRALSPHQVPDLLVIDEAHRVALGRNSPSRDLANRYAQVSELAHRVPRLLLLSATPVLHREHDFLAMLNLLDPDTYGQTDADTFAERVRERERVAESLLLLSPDQPAFLLEDGLSDLKTQFAADRGISDLLDELESALADDVAAEQIKRNLQAQISETYRLHQRLLRNRRKVLVKSDYVVRGRCGVGRIDVSDPRCHRVDRWIERWRSALVADAIDNGGGELLDTAIGAFRVYGTYGGDPDALVDVLNYRLQLKRALKASAGLSTEDAAALRAFERTERQKAAITELLDDLGTDPDPAEGEHLVRALLSLPPAAYVVFTTAQRTALAVSRHLIVAGSVVFTCTGHDGEDDRRIQVSAFVDGTGPRFLICDATGEEGLNLQVADAVVHLDLPWSVSRIEQRIGRLDRYGNRPPVQSFVVGSGPDDGYTHWWLTALRDAFRVFDETTAPTQYAIDTVERALLRTLVTEGVDEAHRALGDVQRLISEEQARIDRIDSLDALAREETDDAALVRTVAEQEPVRAERLADDLVTALKVGGGPLAPQLDQTGAGRWRITIRRETPAIKQFTAIVGHPIDVTVDRAAAVHTRSLSLLRPGAPLIEAIRSQLDADPRLQTCAVWAPATSESEPRLEVRCDLIVEADPTEAFSAWAALEATRPRDRFAARTDADAPLAIAALRRRVDAYLPPRPVSLWFDRDAYEIQEPALIAANDAALLSGHEIGRLAAELQQELARAFGVLTLQELLAPIAERATKAALATEDTQTLMTRGSAMAARDWQARERILTLRVDRDQSNSTETDLVGEREVARQLLDAIRHPVARWTGAALLVRTQNPIRRP